MVSPFAILSDILRTLFSDLAFQWAAFTVLFFVSLFPLLGSLVGWYFATHCVSEAHAQDCYNKFSRIYSIIMTICMIFVFVGVKLFV